jgi:uncharacterized protein
MHMQHLGRGDMQGLLALFAEDIEWITLGEGLPLSGRYRGLAQVAGFFQKVSEMLEISFLEPREFVAQGDRVLVVGSTAGESKPRKTFEGHWVMAFIVRNGKVTNVREHIDTLALARGFEIAPGVAA